MINTLSKIGWEGGWSTSIWIMSNILCVFLGDYPHDIVKLVRFDYVRFKIR